MRPLDHWRLREAGLALARGLFLLRNIDPQVTSIWYFAMASSTTSRRVTASRPQTPFIPRSAQGACLHFGKTIHGILAHVISCIGSLLIVAPSPWLRQLRAVCCANVDSK